MMTDQQFVRNLNARCAKAARYRQPIRLSQADALRLHEIYDPILSFSTQTKIVGFFAKYQGVYLIIEEEARYFEQFSGEVVQDIDMSTWESDPRERALGAPSALRRAAYFGALFGFGKDDDG